MLKDAITSQGVYATPVGSAGFTIIDGRDLAEAAALELLRRKRSGTKLPGETIELVGPEALTGDGIARLWSDVLGRPVTYTGDDLDAVQAAFRTAMPAADVHSLAMIFRGILQEGVVGAPGAPDLAAVIAAARLRRPVLVGWSLGGYVAGAYLRQQGGDRVAGINLVDAVSRLSPDLLTPLAGRFAKSISSHDLGERVAETADFLSACFHQPPTGAELHRMLVVNGMAARAVNEGFTSAAVTDLEPAFQAFTGPVLLTHGGHDALVRLAMSERIAAQRPGRHLSVFADSGHMPFWEEPERYGRELAAFVTASATG